MDEDKVIRPMDFVRLTNIDESNVIKDTKNHIGLVKEVSRDGIMSIIWIGETYSKLAWFKSSELEVVEPACIGKTCGGKRGVRPCSLDWLDRQIIYKHIRRYEY